MGSFRDHHFPVRFGQRNAATAGTRVVPPAGQFHREIAPRVAEKPKGLCPAVPHPRPGDGLADLSCHQHRKLTILNRDCFQRRDQVKGLKDRTRSAPRESGPGPALPFVNAGGPFEPGPPPVRRLLQPAPMTSAGLDLPQAAIGARGPQHQFAFARWRGFTSRRAMMRPLS